MTKLDRTSENLSKTATSLDTVGVPCLLINKANDEFDLNFNEPASIILKDFLQDAGQDIEYTKKVPIGEFFKLYTIIEANTRKPRENAVSEVFEICNYENDDLDV